MTTQPIVPLESRTPRPEAPCPLYEYADTAEELQERGECLARALQESYVEPILERGWVDRETLERVMAAWQNFGKLPGAYWASAWCEAIGRKE